MIIGGVAFGFPYSYALLVLGTYQHRTSMVSPVLFLTVYEIVTIKSYEYHIKREWLFTR